MERLVTVTPEEDARWTRIAENMGGRSGKQCRERWVNNIRPGIKKGDWTIDEDRSIVTMQKEIGNKWRKISDHLPGRTDNDVKNRWYTFMRMLKKQGRTAEDALELIEREIPRRNTKTTAKIVYLEKSTGATTKANVCATMKNIVYEYKTPAKKIYRMPQNGVASSAPGMEFHLGSPLTPSMEESVLAASMLSAMKQGLFSPFKENTHANKIFVRANDIFSPSFFPMDMAMTTPTPAKPLASIASCHSGPFIPNTPVFKENTTESIDAVLKDKYSLNSGNGKEDDFGMTPLPYRLDVSNGSPSPIKYAV